MITRTMSPTILRKEMQTDIHENIIPYLNRNYDNKIRRAIIKSSHLPMIFNPIRYFSKKTNNDWYIFYYANSKNMQMMLLALPYHWYKVTKVLMSTNK